MPLYEFRCRSCRREFELLVRNQERPVCPHCQAAELEKLMRLHGGGLRWHGLHGRGSRAG